VATRLLLPASGSAERTPRSAFVIKSCFFFFIVVVFFFFLFNYFSFFCCFL